MKFRKIIREEIDDLQWIKDVQPNLIFYVTSKLLKPGDIISVTGEMAILDVHNTTWVNNLELEITKVSGKELYHVDFKFVNPESAKKIGFVGGVSEDELAFMPEDGDLIVTSHQKNLNESDDFDWIRDIGPKDIVFRVGDIIRVHNMGTEQSYLNWLGVFAGNYEDGVYGPNIEGEIIDVGQKLMKINTNRGNKIQFPTHNGLPYYIKQTHYDGLDLLYEIIG